MKTESKAEDLDVMKSIAADLALRTAVQHEEACSRVAAARRRVRDIERDLEAAREQHAAAEAERDQLKTDFVMCAEAVADPEQFAEDVRARRSS